MFYRMNKTGKCLLLTAVFVLASVMAVFADPGERDITDPHESPLPYYPSVYQTMDVAPEMNLEGMVAKANLTSLPIDIAPDPILDTVPVAYYNMAAANGVLLTDGSTTNDGAGYVCFPEGFSKFYMDHAGVGRYYYRVYSDAHGWSPWCNSTQTTPTNSDGSKVTALQIRVKGYTYTYNDIYYRAVLSDGSSTGWAKNGQTCGAMGTGRYIIALKVAIWNRSSRFPGATQNLLQAGAYEGMYFADGPKYSTFDGREYTGWAYYGDKQYYFANNNPVQGWQQIDGYTYYFNEDGSVCTDVEPYMEKPGIYELRYNKATKTMYVMAFNSATGACDITYKTFMSSCGPDTPLGSFKTYVKYDWKFMHDNTDDDGAPIYCQKLTRFYDHFLIHSIIYYGAADPFHLDSSTYNYIDNAVSGGCIRLLSGDALWIYNNLPLQTPVTIYEDPWDKGPVEKDAIRMVIPREQTYDPTDPVAQAVLSGQMSMEDLQDQQQVVDDGEVIE